MKKTVTANISGLVFHIEMDAYDKLHQYLSTIRSYFENTAEVDEIISDIEARIAELFKELLKNEREVVTMADVDKVIEIMGEPEQYLGADEDMDSSFSHKKNNRFSKKLYRDPDDHVLGGVCAGIGHYFGIASIWVRLIFLLAFFVYGVGFLPYVILWIIVPMAKTASDKLEMKGEPITADSIGKTIKDEYQNFKKKVDTGNFSSITNSLHSFLAFLGGIVLYVFKFLIKFIAFIVIIGSVIAIFVLLFGLFTTPDFNIWVNGENMLVQPQLLELILDNNTLYYLTVTGLILLIGVPLLGIIYAGLKLFFNIKGGNKAIGFSLLTLWIFSILMLIASTFLIVGKFSSKQTDFTTTELEQFNRNTLYISAYQPEESSMGTSWDGYAKNSPIFTQSGRVYLKNISVNVYPSNTINYQLKVRRKSAGNNADVAKNNVEHISYSYVLEDSVLSINEYLDFPSKDGFRAQQLHISIGVPLGKQVFFMEESRNIMHDVENTSNTWEQDMLGHYWMMTTNGLKCMDCAWEVDDQSTTSDNDQDSLP